MRPLDSKRLVVKVGSNLLIKPDLFQLRESWLLTLVEDLANLHRSGTEVVLVTSGAVALGRGFLERGHVKHLRLEEKQAAAACGQARLVQAYQRLFEIFEIPVAQVLLTIDDSENRRRYLNAKDAFAVLLSEGIIPIVNENDTVATSQLRFGDNDRLAARVAQMVSAELLILLSDIDGLYTANPKDDPNARHIPRVEEIDAQIESMAGGSGSKVGTGGMVTKIMAAKVATASGCHMIIADGRRAHPLQALSDGAPNTLFVSKQTPTSAKKAWIANSLKPLGKVVIDEGACRALARGSSLLPAGVVRTDGSFDRGDAVLIVSESGAVLGKGLITYNSTETERICRCQSSEMEGLLGYKGADELIHRDDMVID